MSLKAKLGSNPYISLMQTAWHYATGERRKYLLVYLMFFMSSLTYSLLPILYGWFINQLQMEGAAILGSLWMYVGLYALIHLVDWAFHGPARIMERELAFQMSQNFLQDMYQKTLSLPVKWHQDNHSGATINRVRKAYEALKEFFENGFEYVHSGAKFLIAFIAMLYFAPLFGLIAIGFGVLIVIVIFKFDKHYIKTLQQVNDREHIVSSTLFDSLSNIITVITLRLESRMQKGLMKKVDDIRPPYKKNIRINEWKWFVVDTLVLFIYIVILVGYVYQNHVPGEVFLIGTLVTVMSYVDRFTSVFHNIAWLYTGVVRKHTDIAAVDNIMKAYDELNPDAEQASLPATWDAIDIQRINYSHQEPQVVSKADTGGNAAPVKAAAVLNDVGIKIEKGQKIALIGESGSGKSTLLALLRGLYPPEDNLSIEVDTQQYDELSVISNKVTLFPQEPEIFENTIAYNITLGLPFSEDQITEVCRSVQFSDVIDQLPNGLKSNIQEKGVNLSGGQRQRLALARGVFAAQDSDIILLDEPTSSVDPMTEMKIYDHLFERFGDKVIVSALHRLHLLSKFDYVYVMESGRVIDEGSFEELKHNSETFKKLWEHQEEVVKS